MKTLPGFRDFYPEDCARRNYIMSTWREVARRHGFVEYDGPVLESIELYQKKSGGELVGQLFNFSDKGDRQVTLRPEMTPTLARMVAARARDFRKPLKWFCVPQFFRYEKPQRGRGREFYQFNADLIGEASDAADAELIALVIDVLKEFGFTAKDFVVRLSSRTAWQKFFAAAGGEAAREDDFFQIVDKIERMPPEKTGEALGALGVPELTADRVLAFLRGGEPGELAPVLENLQARGMGDYVEIDYAIVRGLAYYTGVVFEVFDRSKNERALAGGGRYDRLLALMSDGKVDLPALGFGMGDIVLENLIDDVPAARERRDAWMAQQRACDVYLVVAKAELRLDAVALAQSLRDAGLRVDFPLVDTKVGKQFQAAEQLGAEVAVVVGDEWPQVKVKTLATREEVTVANRGLADWWRTRQKGV